MALELRFSSKICLLSIGRNYSFSCVIMEQSLFCTLSSPLLAFPYHSKILHFLVTTISDDSLILRSLFPTR